jgi:glycosyltransferase involved in cell wall biosynthesis
LSQSRFTDDPPSVSIIVSYLNSARTIGKCLDCLLSQNYPDFRVIVVDGGSVDGSAQIVREKENSRVSFNIVKDCSESEGQTFAASLTDSDVIMFTNSDIYVQNDWIWRHVNWLQRSYDLVGGKVFWGGDKFAFTWNMPRPKGPSFVQQPGLGLGFSNCSVTRAMFAAVGGLKDLKSQHDTEFAFRVVMSGGRMVLDPKIEVYHDHPFKSFKGSFVRAFGYTVNHILVMRAAYGRIVTGSGAPTMLPIGTLLREWTCLAGIAAYRENNSRALEAGIKVGLLEFLFIRLFSTKLGQIVGAFVGAAKRRVAFESVTDLHKRPREHLLPVTTAANARRK